MRKAFSGRPAWAGGDDREDDGEIGWVEDGEDDGEEGMEGVVGGMAVWWVAPGADAVGGAATTGNETGTGADAVNVVAASTPTAAHTSGLWRRRRI